VTVYLDAQFRCHASGSGGMRAAETDFFDGKCSAFIEGYRYVPAGESWTREDGTVFSGEMIAPWKPFDALDAAQREFELSQMADMQAALALLGVSIDG